MEAARAAIKEAHDYLVKNFGNDVGRTSPATETGIQCTGDNESAGVLRGYWEKTGRKR